MVRFRKVALDEMQERIVQMGLTACPICKSDRLTIGKKPTFELIGGAPDARDGVNRDPDANVYFLAHVECASCGYVMLFNSESFISEDTPTLVTGMTEAEEAEAERTGIWPE